MHRVFEATIDEAGTVRLKESIQLASPRRALVIVLNDAMTSGVNDTALLSEASLAESWNRPEEDAAWAHLQSELDRKNCTQKP
jgi:hypothetical protein